MKKAVICLTRGGVSLSKHLQTLDKCDYYIPEKFYDKDFNSISFNCKVPDLVRLLFDKYDALIFIMSTGIVIRSIAELLKNKHSDPAVVVIDEMGQNVISLLSGHVGGANELTLQIAKILNANPVITTSSDVNKKQAVDVFAKKIGAIIENERDLTSVSASIVNGEGVELINDFDNELDFGSTEENDTKAAVIISPYYYDKLMPHIYIRPKCTVLGIGCKKDISYKVLNSSLEQYLLLTNISRYCIYKIATIELKKDEKCINELALQLGATVEIIGIDKIREVENMFPKSDFVKETTGAYSVAQSCAYLGLSNVGKLHDRFAKDGVTICAGIERYF